MSDAVAERVYRYNVVEVWGCMEGRIEVGQHLLEREDHGPDRTLSIYDRKAGAVTGGVFAEFMDVTEVCACGSWLADVDHDCRATP